MRAAALAGPGRGARTFGHAEAFALIAAASFLAARFLPLLELGWPCPFRALTGLPCLTCGMTHAFVHLAHGALAPAVAASPAGALIAALAWLFAVADGARLAVGLPLPRLRAGAVRLVVAVAAVALLANWAALVIAERA